MIYATTKEKNGTAVRLLMNRRFKDDPSKNEEVGIGKDSFGEFQQFQVMDVNYSVKGHRAGFLYLRVHTNLSLAKNMVVTIKDILYFQKSGAYLTVGCTILEESPTEIATIEDVEDNGSGVQVEF